MFTLAHVAPWGRSFDEYRRMFDLTEADLNLRVVGCGDGPASFNAEATRRGMRVVSCDPIYRCDAIAIRERIDVIYTEMLEQARRNADQFIWRDPISSVEKLGQQRMTAMRAFLDDFESGKVAGRYVDAELPALPFPDAAFDLALCSHLLFLYTDHLDEAFHRAAIREMCRVASEVRTFPLLALGGCQSPHVDRCVGDLRDAAYEVSVVAVPYEFQRGANQMLRIWRSGKAGGAGSSNS